MQLPQRPLRLPALIVTATLAAALAGCNRSAPPADTPAPVTETAPMATPLPPELPASPASMPASPVSL